MSKNKPFQSTKLKALCEASPLSYFNIASEITNANKTNGLNGMAVPTPTLQSHATGKSVPSANHLLAYTLYFKKPEKYFFTQEPANAKKRNKTGTAGTRAKR